MDWTRWTGVILLALASLAGSASAQTEAGPEGAYLRAVAEFFGMPGTEVEILRDADIAADEIPVVLFVARRAGVSAEALVALRRSGSSWAELSSRYGVGPNALHIPLPDQASAGRLQSAYDRYRQTPTAEWGGLTLLDDDIVALVNVRLLSQTLGLSPAEVLDRAGTSASFVEIYGRLIR